MELTLEAVFFDHDSSTATGDALTIRRNALIPAPAPEWVRGVTANEHAASPAAYARDLVAGNPITIKALIRTDQAVAPGIAGGLLDPVTIRVLDLNPVRGCLTRVIDALVGDSSPSPDPGVLGEVPATEVIIGIAENTTLVELSLTGTRIADVGIGTHDITWLWQFLAPGSTVWQTFASTKHRIYTVLDAPGPPWTQGTPAASQSHPWIDALEVVCEWCRGITTLDTAADRITQRLFWTGPATFRYACGSALPYYAYADFDLTATLERIRGGVGNGPDVNCTDCASIVSTFANLIGHRLGQQEFGWGLSNGVLQLIGSTAWSSCVGPFGFHEVAWEGTGANTDRVWDACAAVDGDADPGSPPHTQEVPTGLPFAEPWHGSYLWHLITPHTYPTMLNDFAPYPGGPQHRAVF